MRKVKHKPRRGGATVELAVLLPFLAFIFVVAIDYARILYFSQTVETCARNGAIWQCDPTVQAQSPYTTLQEAALADASNLSPQPTVTSGSGTDSAGNAYVTVTVTWEFQTVTNFPGVPSAVNLTRTVQMRSAPQ